MPADVVFVVMVCCVPLLVTVTLAPLITAPWGSVTVPTMLPVLMVVWASNREEHNRHANITKATKCLLVPAAFAVRWNES